MHSSSPQISEIPPLHSEVTDCVLDHRPRCPVRVSIPEHDVLPASQFPNTTKSTLCTNTASVPNHTMQISSLECSISEDAAHTSVLTSPMTCGYQIDTPLDTPGYHQPSMISKPATPTSSSPIRSIVNHQEKASISLSKHLPTGEEPQSSLTPGVHISTPDAPDYSKHLLKPGALYIGGKIGSGAFADVYKGSLYNIPVAVKVVHSGANTQAATSPLSPQNIPIQPKGFWYDKNGQVAMIALTE